MLHSQTCESGAVHNVLHRPRLAQSDFRSDRAACSGSRVRPSRRHGSGSISALAAPLRKHVIAPADACLRQTECMNRLSHSPTVMPLRHEHALPQRRSSASDRREHLHERADDLGVVKPMNVFRLYVCHCVQSESCRSSMLVWHTHDHAVPSGLWCTLVTANRFAE